VPAVLLLISLLFFASLRRIRSEDFSGSFKNFGRAIGDIGEKEPVFLLLPCLAEDRKTLYFDFVCKGIKEGIHLICPCNDLWRRSNQREAKEFRKTLIVWCLCHESSLSGPYPTPSRTDEQLCSPLPIHAPARIPACASSPGTSTGYGPSIKKGSLFPS